MIPVNLPVEKVQALLKGRTRFWLETHRPMKVGVLVYGREAWRGWNCAGPDTRSDELSAGLQKVLLGLQKLTHPSVLQSKEYQEALKAAQQVVKPSGWAEIDYRADMKRARILGLTLEQTSEARVVGQIDVGLTKDPWRPASQMPEWASRFKLSVLTCQKVGPGRFRIRFQKEEAIRAV